MISGIVPFYSIVESVKDETGIQNLRPYYDKIRRLIYRAEKIIGYGGSVRLKKKVYKNEGTYFKYPEDFIEIEGIGTCCQEIPKSNIKAKDEGFCIKEKKGDVVLLYWGLSVDEEGFPIVTVNHEEAVVAFIVWKLYSARVFLGLGNFNLKKDYEYVFNSEVGRARGNDAFPTIEEYSQMSEINSMDRRLLFKFEPLRYNYCADCIDEDCEEIVPEPESDDVYYWQESSLATTFEEMIDSYNADKELFISEKNESTKFIFEEGIMIDYETIGKIGFLIRQTNNDNWTIIDKGLDINVTHIFDKYYDVEERTLIYLSKNIYSIVSMNFKISE